MLVKHNGKDVKLPDFLIVGAMKSGTTSLYYYIKQHPQVFMPKVKELRFFCFMDLPAHLDGHKRLKGLFHILRLDDYAKHFKGAADGQVMGEACPMYLYMYRDTIKGIKKVYGEDCKNLKIIIIMRNPAERAWSQFMMLRREGREHHEDFREALKQPAAHQGLIANWLAAKSTDYIGNGMYYWQVRSFMEEFPKVRIFFYEDLCNDALQVVREIFGFLGVDDGFVPDAEERFNIGGEVVRFKWLNTLVTRRHPLREFVKALLPADIRARIKLLIQSKLAEKKQMPGDVRKELIERHYKDDILMLQGLIKRDLSAWLSASGLKADAQGGGRDGDCKP